MELDQRKLRILRAIIDEYILSASPVGSKSLSQNPEVTWSPATIRNEMADLEELGYLEQPHTSAGRVPSDKAYRLYVDQMMQRAQLSDDEAKVLKGYFQSRINGVETVLRATAQALSEITHYTAVVLMPDLAVNRLRHVQLVPLTQGKALAVVVTDSGVARDAVIDVPADMTPDELVGISRIITKFCYNCRMSEVPRRLKENLGDEMCGRGQFLKRIFDAIDANDEANRRLLSLSGATNMLRYPEYSDVNRAKSFLATVEEKDALYHLMKKASVMEFNITIGAENEQEGLQDCSVVTASYRVNGVQVGTFGVIGPTRMNYSRVLSVLKGVQDNLTLVLQSFLKEE